MLTVREHFALGRLVMTIAITPISDRLTNLLGCEYSFVASSVMFMMSALMMLIYMDDAPSRPHSGYWASIARVFRGIWGSWDVLVLVGIDIAYDVFFFLFIPQWTSIHKVGDGDKLPLSQIAATMSVAAMNGAMLASPVSAWLGSRAAQFAAYCAYGGSLALMAFVFPNKNGVYSAFVCGSICSGGLELVMGLLKGETYPADIRAYIMGLLRVPISLVVAGILYVCSDAERTIQICACILVLCSGLAFVFMKLRSQAKPD
jgi:hypothetical protein